VPPHSLSTRLIVTLTSATILLWIAGSALAALLVRHELNEAFDSAQQELAQRMLPLAVHDIYETDDDTSVRAVVDPEIAEHKEYLTYKIRNAKGDVLLRSHDAPEFDAPLTPGFADIGALRIYTEGTISNSIFIQVAEPLAHRRHALAESTIALLVPLGLLIPLVIGLTYGIVRRTLQPLLSLKEVIGERGRGHLAPLGLTGMPIEIAPIAEATDQLLARLRSGIEAERAFAANSAHELRSPLASALAQLQRLKAEVGDAASRARIVTIENELKRLTNMTSKLLQLSRAEASIAHTDALIDLHPAFDATIDEVRGNPAWGERLVVREASSSRLEGRIDADAFAIALRNLLENALLHGDQASPVEIELLGTSKIQITNGGPAIAPSELSKLTGRFARGPTRANGSGLGLAIAETILRQVGGRLLLRSPAPGRRDGFQAMLELAGPDDGAVRSN
jgi:two-component system OmpR family sensor kinase